MRNGRRKVKFLQRHLSKSTEGTSESKGASKSRLTRVMDYDTVSNTPSFLTQPPLIRDDLATPSSELQDATLAECLPLLNGLNGAFVNPFDFDERGVKQLLRDLHIDFAEDNLGEFPAAFVSIDASRPWMVYWALTALHFLGQDVTFYRSRVVKTFVPLQNDSGGYGGGQGHYSHLAGTYATILSLAIVGGDDAYKLTDRQAMWAWLGRLKQSDGGFQICEGGEEDTRAAYCALLVVSLLNLPWNLPPDAPARRHGLETFGDGLGEYISRCQTYEGGIASAPGTEAHGAYAFCAIAALCLLDAPHMSFPRHLDLDAFTSWLTSRQYAPEGGFAGRTNKVVDGCYSHWIGDCFPLVQAALTGPVSSPEDTDVGNLYSSEGLARYVLNCCQAPDGGLRDKPSKGPDSYHTCYTLAGLSAGEHYHYYRSIPSAPTQASNTDGTHFEWAFAWDVVPQRQRHRHTSGARRDQPSSNDETMTQASLHIHGGDASADLEFDSGCNVAAVHPVFVIPHQSARSMRNWALQQTRLM